MADGILWDEAVLAGFFRNPAGGIARDLAARAIRVETAAKINASHTPPSARGGGPAVRTGRLRASINWRLGEDAIGLFAQIGTDVEYAIWLDGPDQVYDRPFLTTALPAAYG